MPLELDLQYIGVVLVAIVVATIAGSLLGRRVRAWREHRVARAAVARVTSQSAGARRLSDAPAHGAILRRPSSGLGEWGLRRRIGAGGPIIGAADADWVWRPAVPSALPAAASPTTRRVRRLAGATIGVVAVAAGVAMLGVVGAGPRVPDVQGGGAAASLVAGLPPSDTPSPADTTRLAAGVASALAATPGPATGLPPAPTPPLTGDARPAPPPAGGVASPAHASFRVTVTGLTITIANHTRGAGRFAWAFGDGTASSATSPDHTYAGPGTYTVTLIATSTSGAFDRQATQVTVGR